MLLLERTALYTILQTIHPISFVNPPAAFQNFSLSRPVLAQTLFLVLAMF
jgi:hypothetical protein